VNGGRGKGKGEVGEKASLRNLSYHFRRAQQSQRLAEPSLEEFVAIRIQGEIELDWVRKPGKKSRKKKELHYA